MNPALAKKMALMVSWEDNGFNKGAKGGAKSIDELKNKAKEMVKAFAIAAGAVLGLTLAIFKLGKSGAYVKSVEDSWEGLRKKAGLFPGVLDEISSRIDDTVSRLRLMDSNVRALSGGFDEAKVIQYWEMAKQIADVSSQDVQKVFDSLTLSMNKTEYQTLETIGVVLKAGEVNGAYADSINKTVNAMTLADRQAAMHLAIVQKYNKDYLSAGDVATRVKVKFDQWGAKIENLKNKFAKMVAESPSLEKFLDMLITKVDALDKKIDKSGPIIERITSNLVTLAGKAETAGGKIWGARDAIGALASGVLAEKLITGVVSIAAAITAASGGVVAIPAIVGIAVAGLILFASKYKWLFDKLIRWNKFYIGSMIGAWQKWLRVFQIIAEKIPGIGKKMAEGLGEAIAKLDEAKTSVDNFFDGLNEKVQAGPDLSLSGLLERWLFGKDGADAATEDWKTKLDRIVGGKLPGIEPILKDKAAAAPEIDATKERDPLAGYKEIWEMRQDMATFYTDSIIDIERGRHNSYLDMWAKEQADELKNFHDRQTAYGRALGAMGGYSEKFFKKGAHMGRALNAMAIRGFSEMAASYIESKTAQSRIDAFEYAYKAIASAAGGNWVAAGQFGLAAVQAGALAGVGALAAGAIRSWGEGKAEAMTAEAEDEDFAAGSEADAEKQGRRKATGTVNTRPMHVYVNSTANFQAGFMLFGDTEGAASELYNEHFLDRIQSDIDTGVLNVPKTA